MNREFICLDVFNSLWQAMGLSDADLKELQEHLCLYPDSGKVIKALKRELKEVEL